MQYVDINMWMGTNSIPALKGQGTRARWALARSLGITPHGLGKIHNTRYGTITSEDPFNEDDIRKINTEALQKYLGSKDTDFYTLWLAALEKALAWDISEFEGKGREPAPVDPDRTEGPSETTVQQPNATKDDDTQDLNPAY